MMNTTKTKVVWIKMVASCQNTGGEATFATREAADAFIAANSHKWDGWQVGPA
jgi:hypothetical protein